MIRPFSSVWLARTQMANRGDKWKECCCGMRIAYIYYPIFQLSPILSLGHNASVSSISPLENRFKPVV
jgi:hypothetical protein